MARRPRSRLPRGAIPGLPGDNAAVAAPELARESGPVANGPVAGSPTQTAPPAAGKTGRVSKGTPASVVHRTVPVEVALAHGLKGDVRLTMMVRHLDWMLKRPKFGRDLNGHHWVWMTYTQWRDDIFPWASDKTVRRIVDRGRKLGIVVTHRAGYQKPLLYRIDYPSLQRLTTAEGSSPPKWAGQPAEVAEAGIQLDQWAEADIQEVAASTWTQDGASMVKSDHIESGQLNVVTSDQSNVVKSDHSYLYREVLQRSHSSSELASSTDSKVSELDSKSSDNPVPPTDFIAQLADLLNVSPSARELNALRKIERDRLAEREGTPIDPGWASDIDRTMREKWRGIDRPVGVAVYVLRDLIEQERAGDLDMSEPPDWIPRPPTEEELAERQASHEEAMERLTRMQQERTEQEERAKREKQEAEAAAEVERIERERQEAEVAAEAERIVRERHEAEVERIRQAQVRQLAERLERAPERRSKLARYFGAEESDVAAWEAALDLMLQDLELSEVLRHPGLIEVFEAMGLGLEGGGVYRLAFASNLKQQALLRPPGSEIVRTVVIEVLRRIGIDAASVRPVIPSRLGWERSLDQGV